MATRTSAGGTTFTSPFIISSANPQNSTSAKQFTANRQFNIRAGGTAQATLINVTDLSATNQSFTNTGNITVQNISAESITVSGSSKFESTIALTSSLSIAQYNSANVSPAEYVDVRDYDIHPSSSAAPVDVLAKLNTAAADNVPLYFPGSANTANGEGTYYISGPWKPSRGFRGDGFTKSIIKATGTWSSDEGVIDLEGLSQNRQVFSDIGINGAGLADYCVYPSDINHATGAKGEHTWYRTRFADASAYQIYFPDTGSSSGMESVGNVFQQIEVRANSGSGLILLGVASDDITFINPRLFIDGACERIPVRIGGNNTHFYTVFLKIESDFTAGTFTGEERSIWQFRSSGDPFSVNGIFIEKTAGLTIANIDYIFAFSGGPKTEINLVRMTSDASASSRAFVKTNVFPTGTGVTGSLKFAGLNPSSWGFGKLIETRITTGHVSGASHEYELFGVDDFTLANLIGPTTDTSGSTGPFAHITGAHKEKTLNYTVTSNGSAFTLTRKPLEIPSFTVAGLPTVNTSDIEMVYVSNQASAPVPAYSDGTNWRSVIDGTVVSGDGV